LQFALPHVADDANGGWLRFIDTSLPTPNDIAEGTKGSRLGGPSYRVNPRSIIMLHSDCGNNVRLGWISISTLLL